MGIATEERVEVARERCGWDGRRVIRWSERRGNPILLALLDTETLSQSWEAVLVL